MKQKERKKEREKKKEDHFHFVICAYFIQLSHDTVQHSLGGVVFWVDKQEWQNAYLETLEDFEMGMNAGINKSYLFIH